MGILAMKKIKLPFVSGFTVVPTNKTRKNVFPEDLSSRTRHPQWESIAKIHSAVDQPS